MHAVRINRSQTRIATGGESPCDIAVYSLPELRPMTIGERAHSDWLFDLQWIDDQLAVSGSRDGSLAVWKFEERPDDAQPCSHVPWVHMLRNNNVSPGQTGAGVGAGAMWSYPTTRPIKTVRLGEHFDRVRTLVFSERNCSFTCASLSSHMCVIDAATMQRVNCCWTLFIIIMDLLLFPAWPDKSARRESIFRDRLHVSQQ
jgi:WD40 repeat protein